MKKDIIQYIKKWESLCYFDGIPDEAPIRLDQLNKVPSYKRICVSILTNDLEKIGIKNKKSKYYSMLKKIEINARDGNLKQLDLFNDRSY